MPRFLHIADSHLCSKQYGDPRRGADFLNSLLACIPIAASRGITNILHGGDLLDARQLQSEVGPQLEKLDRSLVDAGVTMWVVTGNHDYCEPPWVQQIEERREYWHKGSTPLVGGLRILDHRLVELEGVRVYGLPSLSKDELLAALDVMPAAEILVWHGAVREFEGFPHESSPCIADFPTAKLKAILIGDQHIYRYENADGCLIGYSGSTELASKDEDFIKYATVIEVDSNAAIVVEKVQIPTRLALGWRISNESDMERAIVDLEGLRGTPLLLFVNYSDQLQDVPRRLACCFNADDVVFRPKSEPTPAPPVIALLGEEFATDFAPEQMPAIVGCDPSTFIMPLFADDPALATLAVRMAQNPTEDPTPLLDAYVARELDQTPA